MAHLRNSEAPSPIQLARQRLEREISVWQELLDSSNRRLERLGWIGSRRNGPALRQAIEVQRRVLGDLRAQLRELPERERRPRPAAPEHEPFPRTLERAARQARERGMGLHL